MVETKENSHQLNSNLRALAQAALEASSHDEDDLSRISPVDKEKLIHELQVHQIELKMQNEELRLIQGELEKTRDSYSHLYDFAPIGYFTVNQKGFIDEANLTIASMFGVERGALIGKPFSRFVLKEDQDTFYKLRQRLMETAAPQSCELRLAKKDGQEFYARLGCTAVTNKGDGLKQIRAAVSDITEHKQMEKELLRVKKFESLGLLAGGMAHQFNNALNVITGHIGLLEIDHPQDAEITDRTKMVKQSVDHMARLTSQLLAYAGGGKYNPRSMSLSEFVADILPLIRHTLAPDILLETDVVPDVLNVEMDFTPMHMLLSAIVDNSNEAIDPPGRIGISAGNIDLDQEFRRNHPGLRASPYVYLCIEDNGKGMDEETRERIFEPFFTTHFMGRGLGMASVYGIVANHHGSISVHSEPGKGTAVTIYLPALEAKEEVEAQEKNRVCTTIERPAGEGASWLLKTKGLRWICLANIREAWLSRD